MPRRKWDDPELARAIRRLCERDRWKANRAAHWAKMDPVIRELKKTWIGMRKRCNTPGCSAYKHYGALGVLVCERWDIFDNFVADMGPRPAGLTLDRINPFGNYEPSNCRWATRAVQANNKRKQFLKRQTAEEARAA